VAYHRPDDRYGDAPSAVIDGTDEYVWLPGGSLLHTVDARVGEQAVTGAEIIGYDAQVCTSVQRLYVERAAVDEVSSRLAEALASRRAGDPRDPGSFIGPVISPAEADRIEDWIRRAVDGGARVVAGGGREGSVIQPTVLADVDPRMDVMCREIFGPVVSIRPFDDLDAAINEANDTPYGLAAGIFTGSLDRALHAAAELRMGSVHINETSSSRVDLQPYTGVKLSGYGTEGPRYAIREMTEETLITVGPTA
jgi:acyl-CoA reductase-like NAD-dependent aldehyde dehydrogenase